jgi:hypothetical protein
MKLHQLLLFLFLSITANAADEIYVLTLADAPATLSNGIPFTMEKGDYYPFIGFNASQTLVQLRLGPWTFWARKTNVAPVSDADAPRAAAKYVADATKFVTKLAADIRRAQQEEAASVAAQRALDFRSIQRRRATTDDQEALQRQPAQTVRPNAYGLGVNSDEFGRPHTYHTRDGEQLSPIFQGDVKRDAYGLGVHADQFGRPVYDSKP